VNRYKKFAVVVAAVFAVVMLVGPAPVDAAPTHEPGYPTAFAVCHYMESVVENSVGQNWWNKSRWRQFHYGSKHVTQCEYIIVDAYPAVSCRQLVEGDTTFYRFTGPSSTRCW
jgi:hypothetical protein